MENANVLFDMVDKKPVKRKETLGSFITFVFIVLLIRSFIFSPFRIPSGSMIPTLQVGDFIVTSKFSYGWSRYSIFGGSFIPYFQNRILKNRYPKRGDVMVFSNPNNPKEDWIKRVIGLPGDTVEMKEGRLILNGTMVPLNPIKQLDKESQEKKYEDHDGERRISGDLYEATIPQSEGKTVTYKVLKQLPFGEAELDHMDRVTVPEGHVFCMGDNWDGSSDSRGHLGFIAEKYFLGPALGIFFSINHEKVFLYKPWTWFLLPFNIRFNRCLFHAI